MKYLISLLFLICLSFYAESQNWDIQTLHKINKQYTPSGGKAFKVITESINPVAISLPIGLYIHGTVKKQNDEKWKAYEMASVIGINGLLTTALKVGFHKPRPFVTYPDLVTKHTKAGSYSLPSGHTAMAFSTAVSISLLYPKWYVIAPSMLWASSVAYSRMYLGVHYPTDVLMGIGVGTASSFATHYLFKFLQKKYRKDLKETAFL
jgi:membrane-associated phospholipid phosphatase